MIETTYVRLEKAAAMLETDADTLLIAAVEGRIELHGFFGRFVDAYKFGGSWRVGEEEPIKVIDDDDIFTFVPVGINGAIDLFRDGFFQANILSDPDVNGHYWEVDDEGWADGRFPKPDLKIAKDQIFMKRADVENIKANSRLPEPDTVPGSLPKRKGAETKVYNNQLRLIGGLLELITSGMDEHGKAISTYTQEQIIGYLTDQFPDIPGLGKSHLENTFAVAKRALLGARTPK